MTFRKAKKKKKKMKASRNMPRLPTRDHSQTTSHPHPPPPSSIEATLPPKGLTIASRSKAKALPVLSASFSSEALCRRKGNANGASSGFAGTVFNNASLASDPSVQNAPRRATVARKPDCFALLVLTRSKACRKTTTQPSCSLLMFAPLSLSLSFFPLHSLVDHMVDVALKGHPDNESKPQKSVSSGSKVLPLFLSFNAHLNLSFVY